MATTQYCIHGEENCNRCAMAEVEAPTIHLHLLLDVSTSMCSRWNQTISGLNEYIAALRQDSADYKISISTFGLENELTDLYIDADLDAVKKFDAVSFYPNGRGTALWGAVGISLKKITTSQPVLFVVITDGEENSSLTWTSATVDTLIEERKKAGNYTFAYLGVDKAAWGQEAQVHAFAASNMNLQASQYDIGTYRGLATFTSGYAQTMALNSSLGRTMSVNNLFDPNVEVEDDLTGGTSYVGSSGTTPASASSGSWVASK